MTTITVWLFTYNHENFVEQSVTSILNQSILDGYRLQLLWRDDASTDQTVPLVERLLESSGVTEGVTRLHYKRNRKPTKAPWILDMLERTDGEYIAVLEGDDYWVTDEKLKEQSIILNQYPTINLTFSKSILLKSTPEADGTAGVSYYCDYGDSYKHFTASDVIRGDGGFMPTSTLMLRRSSVELVPDSLAGFQTVGDYLLQVLGAVGEGAIYSPNILSAYRYGHVGSWTNKIQSDTKARLQFFRYFLDSIMSLSDAFPQYETDFSFMLRKHLKLLMVNSMQAEQYMELWQALGQLGSRGFLARI